MAQDGFSALVVEDEPLIALDTEDMLRDCGATRVEIVDQLDAARAKLGGCNYGVVLFDLNLGGVSTEGLVAEYLDRGCRAFVISGADEPPRSLAGKPVRVLSKPVSAATLRSALAEVGLNPAG